MKYLIVVLSLVAVATGMSGCGEKDLPESASPTQNAIPSQQTKKVLNDPNLSPTVKKVIEDSQKQHGTPQR
ncbi:MAG: hypothetical protein H7145_22285 [Akkermansiaceae bacterium]|nr:hypothetical protein [Armatimonadota bacterium]